MIFVKTESGVVKTCYSALREIEASEPAACDTAVCSTFALQLVLSGFTAPCGLGGVVE